MFPQIFWCNVFSFLLILRKTERKEYERKIKERKGRTKEKKKHKDKVVLVHITKAYGGEGV
jgi:3-deoxy-D-manno-octulosonic-acid transferase